ALVAEMKSYSYFVPWQLNENERLVPAFVNWGTEGYVRPADDEEWGESVLKYAADGSGGPDTITLRAASAWQVTVRIGSDQGTYLIFAQDYSALGFDDQMMVADTLLQFINALGDEPAGPMARLPLSSLTGCGNNGPSNCDANNSLPTCGM